MRCTGLCPENFSLSETESCPGRIGDDCALVMAKLLRTHSEYYIDNDGNFRVASTGNTVVALPKQSLPAALLDFTEEDLAYGLAEVLDLTDAARQSEPN